MDDDINAEDDNPAESKADLVRVKLKLAAHYAMLGFVPAVSILALIVALISYHNRSEQMQNNEYASRINSLSSALSDIKGDMETLKVAIAREKSVREEESKKTDEQNKLIVLSISDLQVKLKIAPTLSEQLQKTAAATASVSSLVSTASASPALTAPKETPKQSSVAAPAAEASEKKSVASAPIHAPAGAGKKKQPAPVTPKKADKQSAQVKALRDAIEQFNKE